MYAGAQAKSLPKRQLWASGCCSQLWHLQPWQLQQVALLGEGLQQQHLSVILHARQEAEPVDHQPWAVPVGVGAVLRLQLAGVAARVTKAGLAVDPVHQVPAATRASTRTDGHLAEERCGSKVWVRTTRAQVQRLEPRVPGTW
eukprot:GHRQ01020658.1.p2 GENE.GHRQ01020658.1~~GHRQ01020658.1.p2  ORF type:complete len:143 (-),score=29.92 GHRQ01020658.1:465-893(-)